MNIKVRITQIDRKTGLSKSLEFEGFVKSDFDEHDTAAILFSLEFAANNHSEIPMRVHITEIK